MIKTFIAAFASLTLWLNTINIEKNLPTNKKLYTNNTITTTRNIENHAIDNNVLFVVAHSKSPNLVIYKANYISQTSMNDKKPIDVFWLMRTKGNKTEELSFIEWKMAFGFKLHTIKKDEQYKIKLNAIKNKFIYITKNKSGNFDSFITINKIKIKLKSVYAKFEYTIFGPDVEYLDFKGINTATGKEVVERQYSN